MKKFSGTKEIIDLAWDVYMYEENSDDAVDLFYLLNEFADELKSDSKGAINVIENKITQIKEWCVKKKVCPECGERLEFEHNPDYDTYVPYGDTTVLESEGGCLVCHNCGFRAEE